MANMVVIIVVYLLPLIGIVCFLLRNLSRQFGFLKTLPKSDEKRKNIILKIIFVIFGILYAFFCLIGILLLIFKPSWFDPPRWLIISFIVFFVPYLSCVIGFLGIGYAGHGGASPSKIVMEVYEDVRKDKKKRNEM